MKIQFLTQVLDRMIFYNQIGIDRYFCGFGGEYKRSKIMSDAEMNSYRLTSMEEHGDESMAQIKREVAKDARESTF